MISLVLITLEHLNPCDFINFQVSRGRTHFTCFGKLIIRTQFTADILLVMIKGIHVATYHDDMHQPVNGKHAQRGIRNKQ